LYVFFLGIKSSQVFVTKSPLFCSPTVFQLFSSSRDSSASYRTARTSVNPSSRYGKLDPLRVVCFVLYRCELWFAWVCVLLWAYELLRNLCWVWVRVVQVRTVANTDSLAQASLTRPGEMCGGSPRVSCASGPPGDQSVFWASRKLAQARGVSPKRDPALLSYSFLSPRLGGGGLALAGLSRLSEIPQPWRGAGRNSVVFLDVCCSWMVCFGWVWMYDEWYVYNGVWGISSMIPKLQMMGLVWKLAWSLHDLYMMSWLHMYVCEATNLAWVIMNLSGW